MRAAVTVCRLGNIPVDVQASWPPVFLFVTWTLSERFFPQLYPHWSQLNYWALGLISSILLFGSLLAHEMGHATIAQNRGLSVFRVSLFLLGGLAEIDVDDGTAADEFWMASAGPLVSILLAVAFCVVWLEVGWTYPFISAVALYLGISNGLLAAFNLLPGYPLDGGRILRSAFWAISGDQGRATRWAGWVGQGIGGSGVVLGLAWLATGDFLAGLWLALVGAFLIFAARGAIPASFLGSS